MCNTKVRGACSRCALLMPNYHIAQVSSANLKVPHGNKDKGKTPVPRQHEAMSSQVHRAFLESLWQSLSNVISKSSTVILPVVFQIGNASDFDEH